MHGSKLVLATLLLSMPMKKLLTFVQFDCSWLERRHVLVFPEVHRYRSDQGEIFHSAEEVLGNQLCWSYIEEAMWKKIAVGAEDEKANI